MNRVLEVLKKKNKKNKMKKNKVKNAGNYDCELPHRKNVEDDDFDVILR